jgi:ribose transport system ATP-binding protein
MYELKAVEKKFPGVHALKAVNFQIARGEIIGLVGENGAGKSTLMKVLYGAYQADGGTILKDGIAVRFQNPRQAMEKGIGMVFQEQSLIANLTVMENIFLGYEAQFQRFGVMQWGAMAKAAKAQLAKVHLDIDPGMVTANLSFAQRQLVELAKVLTLEERVDGDLVILLDEPTSVLSEDEVKMLFGIVRDLTKRASFIFVSHRMDEVMELSDRIYVMKDGQVVDVVTRGG